MHQPKLRIIPFIPSFKPHTTLLSYRHNKFFNHLSSRTFIDWKPKIWKKAVSFLTVQKITTPQKSGMASESNQDWKQISEEEWKKKLTPQEYQVCRQKGTERPWTGEYNKFYEPGEYDCTCCGAKLFVSDDKFDSGCGWPAFDKPADNTAVTEHSDHSHGMVRTEVTCSSCGAHLGHVFNDGPKQTTGIRYCINSVSLKYKKPAK